MSREEIIFDAITGIREELVEEAQEYRFREKRAPWQRYASLAACLALAGTLCFGAYQLTQIRMKGGSDCCDMNGAPPPQSSEQADQDAGVTSPPENGTGHDAKYEDAPEAMPPDMEPEGGESFLAVVLEVRVDALLVARTEGEHIIVPTAALEELPELQAGDVVQVLCAEILSGEEGAATASGVEAVRLAEP